MTMYVVQTEIPIEHFMEKMTDKKQVLRITITGNALPAKIK